MKRRPRLILVFRNVFLQKSRPNSHMTCWLVWEIRYKRFARRGFPCVLRKRHYTPSSRRIIFVPKFAGSFRGLTILLVRLRRGTTVRYEKYQPKPVIIDDTGCKPFSVVGFRQVFSNQNATPVKSNALFACPAHVVLLNCSITCRRWVVEKSLSFMSFLTEEFEAIV